MARGWTRGGRSALLIVVVGLGARATPTGPQGDLRGDRHVAPPHIQLWSDGAQLAGDVRILPVGPGQSIRLTLGSRAAATRSVEPILHLDPDTESALEWRAERGTILGQGPVAQYVAPRDAGVDHLRVVAPQSGAPPRVIDEFRPLVWTPLADKRHGTLSGYVIGDYPEELGLTPADPRRAGAVVPGLIPVLPQDEELPVSRHFRLRDFLCKQQPEHYPKYVFINVRLLDKLERLVDRLDAIRRRPTNVVVMSGYRTPSYNRIVGNETIWSRHTLGDAADVFVDDDHDGVMDDLDGDGKITRADAETLLRVVDELDQDRHLAGGAATYPATAAHGPFVHVDVRGYRARW